jgi:ribonuclease R
MVSLRGLAGDFYEYDEDNYCIKGRRSGKKYQMGDPVKVEIVRVNMEKKQIDFSLVSES